MRVVVRILGAVLAAVGLAGVGLGALLWWTGISAKQHPGPLETFVAGRARHAIISGRLRARKNPVPLNDEVLKSGMAHFADHCASCHANDGSGDTEIGRNLYPRAPDMRLPATQALSDGELFEIIESGVRFTGMPGWGDGTPEGVESSWTLVHFIRHLPALTASELDRMQQLNPKTADELREEEEIRRFLEEGEAPAPSPPTHKHGGH